MKLLQKTIGRVVLSLCLGWGTLPLSGSEIQSDEQQAENQQSESSETKKNLYGNNQLIIKVGLDIPGILETTGNYVFGEEVLPLPGPEQDIETGVTLAGEIFHPISKVASLGMGVSYQLPRTIQGFEDKFNFIPIYGALKWHPLAMKEMTPQLVVHVGYNFLEANSAFKMRNRYFGNGLNLKELSDLRGGLYWGWGVKIPITRFWEFEVLYSAQKGSAKGDFDLYGWPREIPLDLDYSQIGFSISCRFPGTRSNY